MKNPFNPNDSVKFKDGDDRIFKVYSVYDVNHVSLGLFEYPDTEQDNLVNISEIIKV